MDINKIKTGDILIIEGEEYEVIKVYCDANLTKDDKLIEFLCVELHDVESESLHPTHELRQYQDKETWFAEIIPSKEPPKWTGIKSKGVFEIANHKKINPTNISLKK